eukprot:3330997-Pyramimonas_sp.AAC.1
MLTVPSKIRYVGVPRPPFRPRGSWFRTPSSCLTLKSKRILASGRSELPTETQVQEFRGPAPLGS